MDCPLVLIEWEDSTQPLPGWCHLSDFDDFEVVKCASVGWLIHDGDDVKALAPNMGTKPLQVSGVIRIPARAVTAIKLLCETKDLETWLESRKSANSGQ